MIIFLLGLGDRHTQNILVDSRTGEVIHIDLGVAFDAGLLLKTPERVPFRLTRDMVDALGVRGTHGSFRRHCCAVLTHLRTQQAVFDTMLSVFVFDPLYRWSLSPAKVARIQGGSLMPRVKQASSKNERLSSAICAKCFMGGALGCDHCSDIGLCLDL